MLLRLLALAVAAAWHSVFANPTHTQVEQFLHGHTNNWAIIVCTSRFWYNYRHMANTLSIYHVVKNLGIPDSQIILMLADDVACNPRNLFPGNVFNSRSHSINVYGENVEVDYRGYDVNVENIIRVLTGRHEASVPRSKRLASDDRSNVLVYMTGHGGDGFLKVQDSEEITSHDLADAFAQMYEKRRYNELLFIIETCQAGTMFEQFYSPNILAIASSVRNQSSYSVSLNLNLQHHMDSVIGTPVIDRFTYYLLKYLKDVDMKSELSIIDWINSWDEREILSTPIYRTDLYKRPLNQVRLTDFFGNVQSVEILSKAYPVAKTLPKIESSLGDQELNKLLKNRNQSEAAPILTGTIAASNDSPIGQFSQTQKKFQFPLILKLVNILFLIGFIAVFVLAVK